MLGLKLEWLSRYRGYARAWVILGTNAYNGNCGVARGQGVKLSTYIYLMPALRMSGAIPLPPLYVSMVLTGTVSPYIFILH